MLFDNALQQLSGKISEESLHFTSREFLHAKLDALLDECALVSENAAFGQTFDDMENFSDYAGFCGVFLFGTADVATSRFSNQSSA